MDLVSIVVPSYCPTTHLLDALASARSQTYPSVEVILIDDGSDQLACQSVVKQAARQADLYIAQPNRGLPAARNAGFRAARGRYIVPLDADDLIDTEYVSACVAALEAVPDAAFAYTAYKVFGTQRGVEEPGEYNLYRLLDRNFLTYAAMIRREDWEQAGGYDESMRLGYEDWEFWLRLGGRHRYGAYVPQPLFYYRKNGSSLYGVALNRHAEITAYIQSRHPELYEDHALACIKRRWSPAVCLVSPTPHKPQTIEDIELRITGDRCPPDELSAAPAFLLTESGDIDPHSAELAALAVWSGRSECQLPDGSVALSREAARNSHKGKLTIAGRSRRAKGVASSPIMGKWGVFRRHLTNAELLTWRVWFRHPLRSAMRLVPLRIKEGINKAARRRIFDLSFYLQFQPGSLVLANTVIQPLRYFPKRDASRPRIALITPHLGPGGAEAVLQQIATTLRVERFEVLLLATQSRDSRWLNRWRGCVEHVYDLAAAVAPERVPASVFTIVSNWKCDAVLVQNSLPGYAALPQIKSEAPGTRVVDLIHALDDRWDQISLTSDVAAHIDLRVAASAAVRERLLKAGSSPAQVRLIRNGVDLERFRPSPVRTDGVHRILFAGRLDPVKRPLLLVKTAARLAELRNARDFRMVVAGDGPDAFAFRKKVSQSGLESVFEFHGYVDDLAPLFAGCDVCVLPSRAEGIPLVVLEALASSRPVVASNVGGIREVLDPSCGVLIDVGGAEAGAFAAALSALLERPDVRASMGETGRRRVTAEYDLLRMREEYLQVLDPRGMAGSPPIIGFSNRSTEKPSRHPLDVGCRPEPETPH